MAVSGIRLYAKALADINDPAATAQVQMGLQSLASGVSGLTAGSLPPQKASIAANLVAAAIRSKNAARIRSSIAETQPIIEVGAKALAKDFESLQHLIVLDHEAWKADRKRNLRILKDDPRTSAAELQSAYRASVDRHIQNARLVAAYGQNIKAIGDFEKAHADLISSEDGDRALDEFLTTTQNLANDLAALRNPENS